MAFVFCMLEFSVVLDFSENPSTNPVPKPKPRTKSHLQSPTAISIGSPQSAEGPTHENRSLKKPPEPNFRLGNEEWFPAHQPKNDYSMEEILTSLEAVKPFIMNTDKSPQRTLADLQLVGGIPKDPKPPAVVGVIPKTPQQDSLGRRRCFQIAQSLALETASLTSKSSRGSLGLEDEISDVDENMFSEAGKVPEAFNQLFEPGMFLSCSSGTLF